jgi:hypothetical protein
MDKPAEFYYNYEKEVPAMSPADYAARRLAKARASEIGSRNDMFVPSLKETYFGNAATLKGSKSFSIEGERHKARSEGSRRALELGHLRKLTSSSEKHKFF